MRVSRPMGFFSLMATHKCKSLGNIYDIMMYSSSFSPSRVEISLAIFIVDASVFCWPNSSSTKRERERGRGLPHATTTSPLAHKMFRKEFMKIVVGSRPSTRQGRSCHSILSCWLGCCCRSFHLGRYQSPLVVSLNFPFSFHFFDRYLRRNAILVLPQTS